MNNIFKKIIAISLICIISFSLTGCGDKNNNTNSDDVINKTKDNKQSSNKKNNDSNEVDEINLYSDDTKIVFSMQDVYYIVFYHNGNNITGLEYIYNYPDKETAKIAETAIRTSYEAEQDVEKVELKGKQLRIKFKESAYQGQTLESIKQTYSYLKEVKEN